VSNLTWPENRVCSENFHRVTIQDFCPTLRLPWKTERGLDSLHSTNIFYQLGSSSNFCLTWKTDLAWKFPLHWNTFCHSGFLRNFTLAMKDRVDPEIFHCIECTFSIKDFWKSCACPEKLRGSWNIFTVLNIFFTIQDFWATCACPEKQSVPRKFSLHLIYIFYH